MEKLNKLLEEYPNGKGDLDSLKFLKPFIKWLVENDKINVKEIGKIGMTKIKGEPTSYMFDKIYSDLESLLMLLSISDTPIEDLISYLK